MSVTLRVGTIYVDLVHPYMVPLYLSKDYLNGDIGWRVNDQWIDIPNDSHCPLCDRHIQDASSMRGNLPSFVMCPDYDINHHVGYQLRICVDCKYWVMCYRGYELKSVPKTIRKKLEQGYRPCNIDIYLS